MTVELRTSERYEVTLQGPPGETLIAAGMLVKERKAMGHEVTSARFASEALDDQRLVLQFTTRGINGRSG